MRGNRYGTHRVIAPAGALPQAAEKVDNDMTRLFDDEILIDVERLNIDSASFELVPTAISVSVSGFSAQPTLPVMYQPATTTRPSTMPARKFSLFSQNDLLKSTKAIRAPETTRAMTSSAIGKSIPSALCSR